MLPRFIPKKKKKVRFFMTPLFGEKEEVVEGEEIYARPVIFESENHDNGSDDIFYLEIDSPADKNPKPSESQQKSTATLKSKGDDISECNKLLSQLTVSDACFRSFTSSSVKSPDPLKNLLIEQGGAVSSSGLLPFIPVEVRQESYGNEVRMLALKKPETSSLLSAELKKSKKDAEAPKKAEVKNVPSLSKQIEDYLDGADIDPDMRLKDGNPMIFLCIQKGFLEPIKKLASLNANFECKNKNGKTPLEVAYIYGIRSPEILAYMKVRMLDPKLHEVARVKALKIAVEKKDIALFNLTKNINTPECKNINELNLLYYIENRDKAPNYKQSFSFFCFEMGLGFSRSEKIAAAAFALKVLRKESFDEEGGEKYLAACSQGELGDICKKNGVAEKMHQKIHHSPFI